MPISRMSITTALIPTSQQFVQAPLNHAVDTVDLVSLETATTLHAHWVEPELGYIAVSLHVNMRRLVTVDRVYEEPIGTHAQKCRHNRDGSIVSQSVTMARRQFTGRTQGYDSESCGQGAWNTKSRSSAKRLRRKRENREAMRRVTPSWLRGPISPCSCNTLNRTLPGPRTPGIPHPKYARCIRSELSSSRPLPSATMRPVSNT